MPTHRSTYFSLRQSSTLKYVLCDSPIGFANSLCAPDSAPMMTAELVALSHRFVCRGEKRVHKRCLLERRPPPFKSVGRGEVIVLCTPPYSASYLRNDSIALSESPQHLGPPEHLWQKEILRRMVQVQMVVQVPALHQQ
ncbi:unnamed protein product [Ectocarpus sp. 12 AP-2014]